MKTTRPTPSMAVAGSSVMAVGLPGKVGSYAASHNIISSYDNTRCNLKTIRYIVMKFRCFVKEYFRII